MYNSRGIGAYKKVEVNTSDGRQLILLLYKELLKMIDESIGLILLKDLTKSMMINNKLRKAQDIVTELAASLNFEEGGQLAIDLNNIYIFIHNTLINANISKDEKSLQVIKPVILNLLDAWQQVVDVDTNKPNKDNSFRIQG